LVASVEVSDDTVILVAREVVAAIVADRGRWVTWWPDLEVAALVDDGVDGMRWTVAGALVGVAEVRLVPQARGVSVRYALMAEPTEPGSRTTPRRLPDSPHGRRELESLRRRQALAWKAVVWRIKDEAEATPNPSVRWA
jgi:hypothetical protein